MDLSGFTRGRLNHKGTYQRSDSLNTDVQNTSNFYRDHVVIPMFRLLGTPSDQKRHVVEEGSHFVPHTRLIQEVLTWLDKYQPLPQ